MSVLVPHLDNYPLQSYKYNNYIIWKGIVTLLHYGANLSESGLAQILILKDKLNK